MQNSMEELFGIMNVLDPDKYSDEDSFLARFGKGMPTPDQVQDLQVPPSAALPACQKAWHRTVCSFTSPVWADGIWPLGSERGARCTAGGAAAHPAAAHEGGCGESAGEGGGGRARAAHQAAAPLLQRHLREAGAPLSVCCVSMADQPT